MSTSPLRAVSIVANDALIFIEFRPLQARLARTARRRGTPSESCRLCARRMGV